MPCIRHSLVTYAEEFEMLHFYFEVLAYADALLTAFRSTIIAIWYRNRTRCRHESLSFAKRHQGIQLSLMKATNTAPTITGV